MLQWVCSTVGHRPTVSHRSGEQVNRQVAPQVPAQVAPHVGPQVAAHPVGQVMQVGPHVAAHPVGQVMQVTPQLFAQVLAQVAAQVFAQVLAQVMQVASFRVGQSPQVRQVPPWQVSQVCRQVSQVSQVTPCVSRQVRGLHTVQPLGHSKAVGQPISLGQSSRVGPGHSASQVAANAAIGWAIAVLGCTENGSDAPATAVRT